jgi:hypothetical protein
MPSLLPDPRWALTPPFRPYPLPPKTSLAGPLAVCFLLHYLSHRCARALPGTVFS